MAKKKNSKRPDTFGKAVSIFFLSISSSIFYLCSRTCQISPFQSGPVQYRPRSGIRCLRRHHYGSQSRPHSGKPCPGRSLNLELKLLIFQWQVNVCTLLKNFRPVASQLKLKLAASFNLTMSITDTCQEKIGFKNVYNGFIRNKGGPQQQEQKQDWGQ